jgi:hypothetical protein
MGQKRHEKGTDPRGVIANSLENKKKDFKKLLAWYKRRFVLRVPQALVHAASAQVLKQPVYSHTASFTYKSIRSPCPGLPLYRTESPVSV